jgi:hypothetical protein
VGATFDRLVDLDKILLGDGDIEGDLDSVLLNPVASTIPSCGGYNFEIVGGIG